MQTAAFTGRTEERLKKDPIYKSCLHLIKCNAHGHGFRKGQTSERQQFWKITAFV